MVDYLFYRGKWNVVLIFTIDELTIVFVKER